jgi:hypothetical protein
MSVWQACVEVDEAIRRGGLMAGLAVAERQRDDALTALAVATAELAAVQVPESVG